MCRHSCARKSQWTDLGALEGHGGLPVGASAGHRGGNVRASYVIAAVRSERSQQANIRVLKCSRQTH
jgi:hypothetical protein